MKLKWTRRLVSLVGLDFSKRKHRRNQIGIRQPPAPLNTPNHTWYMVFNLSFSGDGGRTNLLTIIDDFTKESVSISLAVRSSGEQLVNILDNIAASQGYPKAVRTDLEPEFASRTLVRWAHYHGIRLLQNQPLQSDSDYVHRQLSR